ncbi:MAG: hypothetical protein P4L57_08265 [Rhizomicrobium sp.]|nr:hypothetical protein [Rhizomicrobium sp.]
MLKEFTGTDNREPPWFKWTTGWLGTVRFWPCNGKGWALLGTCVMAMVFSAPIAAAVFNGDADYILLTVGAVSIPFQVVGFMHAEAD